MANKLRRKSRLRCEGLEPRLALSTFGPDGGADIASVLSALSVTAVVPADGSSVTAPLASLQVTFDRPIDPFTLNYNDLTLERLDAQGEPVWATDPSFDILEGTLDDIGTSLTVTLPSSLDLEAGTYRVSISPWSFLMGVDGSFLESMGTSQHLATFQLQDAPRQGPLLDSAVELGTLGPGIRRVDGNLELVLDPAAVALYRFNLADGHFWRFGAEVRSDRDGGSLNAALAIFDAEGKLIKTSILGLADSPNDPYLFAGLPAGTYYVGISDVKNVPGEAGGYDPALGLLGVASSGQLGGAFRLRLTADAADAPAEVRSFQLDYADARDPSPTGFTIDFSGLVAPADVPGTPQPDGVLIADRFGQEFRAILVGQDANTGRLRYVFDARLPVGQYAVRLPAAGGLRDLADYAPVAKELPAGDLATFEVVAARGPHAPQDFGAVFPDQLLGKTGGAFELAPGESIEYRFVAVVAFQCEVAFTHTGGPVRVEVQNLAKGQSFSFDISAPGRSSYLVFYEPGEYRYIFTATGRTASGNEWSIEQGYVRHERLTPGGVGRDSALSLRLVSSPVSRGLANRPALPQPVEVASDGSIGAPKGTIGSTSQEPPTAGGKAPTDVPFGAAAAGEPFTGAPTPATNGALTTVIGASLLPGSSGQGASNTLASTFGMNLGGDLVGRPGADGDLDTDAAPSGLSGNALSLADAMTNRMPGARRGESNIRRPRDPDAKEIEPSPPTSGEVDLAESTDGTLGATNVAQLTLNDLGLLDLPVGWLENLAARVLGWGDLGPRISSDVQDDPELRPEIASLNPVSLIVPETPSQGEGAEVSKPDRGTDPMALVVAAAVVVEGRRHLVRWLGRRNELSRAGSRRSSGKQTWRRGNSALASAGPR